MTTVKERMTSERIAALRSSAASLTKVDHMKGEKTEIEATLDAAELAMTNRLRAKADADEKSKVAADAKSKDEVDDKEAVALPLLRSSSGTAMPECLRAAVLRRSC